MPEPERTAVDLVVTGRVQGVSFRAYAEREAARLGVVGWVRNEPGGAVAAHAEGPADAIDAFVRWCHEGPSWARVEGVDVQPGEDTGATSFRIRY
ncbi:MAG: acylphosphatase [Nocardioides sp.]|nr:acylphosphatase [Nocardioidaceae bacterium]MCB8957154.1 acylphosphatase [Nocardioides sp.]